jgi:hypothetical protein
MLVSSPARRSQEAEKKIHHGRRGREVEEVDGDAATTAHMMPESERASTHREIQ